VSEVLGRGAPGLEAPQGWSWGQEGGEIDAETNCASLIRSDSFSNVHL
jgi:hypothetical protein